MNPLDAVIPVAIALILFIAIRYNWIPRGFYRALAEIVILLAAITTMGFLMIPYLGR